MILVETFRVFILVVGLYGVYIHPSQAQNLKCMQENGQETCKDDNLTPNCGVTTDGNPTGCIGTSECPGSVPDDKVVCEAGKCCCKAGVAPPVCNDLGQPPIKEQACTVVPIKTSPLCVPPSEKKMECHDEKGTEMTCPAADQVCGIKMDGTEQGCVAPVDCQKDVGDELKCDPSDNVKMCCCKAANCNSKENVCKEPTLSNTDKCKGPATPPPPRPPPPPIALADDGNNKGGIPERSIVMLALGPMIGLVIGFFHRISSLA